jgi:hypothetical protein
MSIYTYVSNFSSLQIILPTFDQYLFKKMFEPHL